MSQALLSFNGNWKVSKLVGIDSLSKSPTLIIDVNAKKISGNAGCNSYGTAFSIEEDQIKFETPLATKMFCTNMNIEKAFFNCLKNTSNYKFVDGNLTFYDKEGIEQITCAKTEE